MGSPIDSCAMKLLLSTVLECVVDNGCVEWQGIVICVFCPHDSSLSCRRENQYWFIKC